MDKLKNSIFDISNNHFKYLMNLENVNGVGYGYKYINDKNTLEPCIHVLVENKVNKNYLSKSNIIPNRYMGIKTDVINVGLVSSLSNDISSYNVTPPAIPYKLRPLMGGCCIGQGLKSGTLGCIVAKMGNDDELHYYILSNNHVIANTNAIQIGISITQPSEKNGGNWKYDAVAYLSTFIPLKFMDPNEPDLTKQPVNFVDCAIAEIYDESLLSMSIYGQGVISGVDYDPVLGLKVKKVGFQTGLTEGEIITENLTTQCTFSNNRTGLFKHVMMTNLKSSKGDSGSLILKDNNEAIGLLFAGPDSDDKNYCIFSTIDQVLTRLNVYVYIDLE